MVPIYYISRTSPVRAANIAICMIGSILLVKVIEISNSLTEKYYKDRIDSLTDEANTDALTKMWNRRYSKRFLANKFEDKKAIDKIFIAMVDIDFFKKR